MSAPAWPSELADSQRNSSQTGLQLRMLVASVAVVSLDLSFLTDLPGSPPVPAAPVNVYDILQDAWRESRVDMTLRFFLDPAERHGLGPLVIDALLALLDGAPTIGPQGRSDRPFDAQEHLGSAEWEINTQVQFIDVLATNEDTGIAVVLENKISHDLNNPLDQYAGHILKDSRFPTVLVAVLAPERRTASGEQQNWLSKAVRYPELGKQVKASPALVEHLLNPVDRDQRRSLDLLHQFMEARSGGTNMPDLTAEAEQIDQWRALQAQHHEAIKRFFEERSSVRRLLRERNKRLTPLIADGLDQAGLETGWESHGGYEATVWNAYHFPDPDWSVELKLTTEPDQASIFVFDYPGRTYKNITIEPLGLEWTARDDEVASAFVERVRQILEQVGRGERGTPPAGG